MQLHFDGKLYIIVLKCDTRVTQRYLKIMQNKFVPGKQTVYDGNEDTYHFNDGQLSHFNQQVLLYTGSLIQTFLTGAEPNMWFKFTL